MYRNYTTLTIKFRTFHSDAKMFYRDSGAFAAHPSNIRNYPPFIAKKTLVTEIYNFFTIFALCIV